MTAVERRPAWTKPDALSGAPQKNLKYQLLASHIAYHLTSYSLSHDDSILGPGLARALRPQPVRTWPRTQDIREKARQVTFPTQTCTSKGKNHFSFMLQKGVWEPKWQTKRGRKWCTHCSKLPPHTLNCQPWLFSEEKREDTNDHLWIIWAMHSPIDPFLHFSPHLYRQGRYWAFVQKNKGSERLPICPKSHS